MAALADLSGTLGVKSTGTAGAEGTDLASGTTGVALRSRGTSSTMASGTNLSSAALRIGCATSRANATVADLSGSSTLGVEKTGPAGTEGTDLARITLRGVVTIHTELGLTDFARSTAIVGRASSDAKAVATDLRCRALRRLGTGSTCTRGADLSGIALSGIRTGGAGSSQAHLTSAAARVG